jgi:hypothetical protein
MCTVHGPKRSGPNRYWGYWSCRGDHLLCQWLQLHGPLYLRAKLLMRSVRGHGKGFGLVKGPENPKICSRLSLKGERQTLGTFEVLLSELLALKIPE